MREKISVEEFDLLMRSLERELRVDPGSFRTGNSGSIAYRKGDAYVYVSDSSCGLSTMYVSLNVGANLSNCERPFWNWRKRKQWDASVALYNTIYETVGGIPKLSDVEAKIVESIPSAKDIIAERALLGDHGN